MAEVKYCPKCGKQVEGDTKFCPVCGASLDGTAQQPQIVITNVNTNTNTNTNANVVGRRLCNKWVSLALCIFTICGHKFYEGRIGMGLVYLFTFGFFGIGWFIDILTILFKPNPYAV